jgi:ABC-type multidrug transport system fused ATPase/permease subunit
VSFAYEARKPVLKHLSFKVEPGTKTAIVGESGSGKSTCLKLLYRFYDVSDGSIEIDHQDLRRLNHRSYRKHIGVVPQDTILFNTTIMYNLRYADPDTTDEEVYQACRAASIHDRILSFPDGYDTKVGERGLRLSGGEKQRVCIRIFHESTRMTLILDCHCACDTQRPTNRFTR